MSLASKPGSKCAEITVPCTPLDLVGKVIHLSDSHGNSCPGIDRFYIPVAAKGTAVEYLAITLTPILRSPVQVKSRVETGCLSPGSFSGHHYIPGVSGSIE